MEPTLTERLVNRLARRPTTRRGFLAAATVGGAALAADPWGYLTRPVDAYAAVCGPGNECNQGWSVMCCTIHDGKNSCPPGSFPGGWWKADRSSYCGGHARYYIDCNARPGTHWRCHCNKRTCDRRRVACNVFRYGQCNTQVPGVTAVVCRQISCTPPWQLYPGHCSSSSATDNNTAEHTAPCLTRRNTFPRLRTFRKAPHLLQRGHTLRAGQHLTSKDRHTTVVFTAAGDLELENERGIIWRSHTSAAGGHARLLANGNFVIRTRHGHTVWATHTAHHTARAHVKLQNNGALVVLHDGRIVWSTHTHTP